MTIYIVSDLSNKKRVDALAKALTEKSHYVLYDLDFPSGNRGPRFIEWVSTDVAQCKFRDSIDVAMSADLVIYVGPSGTDSAAQLGVSFASGIDILGITEAPYLDPLGLMRKLIKTWFSDQEFMVEFIHSYYKEKSFGTSEAGIIHNPKPQQ